MSLSRTLRRAREKAARRASAHARATSMVLDDDRPCPDCGAVSSMIDDADAERTVMVDGRETTVFVFGAFRDATSEQLAEQVRTMRAECPECAARDHDPDY